MTDLTITVYVRRCGQRRDECRQLTFELPDGLPQSELLDWGWAIDGNQAIKQVTDTWEDAETPVDGRLYDVHVPVADVLREEQVALVKQLGEKGYAVKFA